MTKKDFQVIAATIANTVMSRSTRVVVAQAFADALAPLNPRFKRDLFIQAATGQVSVTARRARSVPLIRVED